MGNGWINLSKMLKILGNMKLNYVSIDRTSDIWAVTIVNLILSSCCNWYIIGDVATTFWCRME